MNKKDWIIRRLAQKLVWLGDCTFKKKDMDVCPMVTLHTSAMQSQNICVDCVIESAEDAWAKLSELQNGSPKCPCSVRTRDEAFNVRASGKTSVSAILKAMQILEDEASNSDSDAVSFRIEAGQSDECIPSSPFGLLEAMHQQMLSECEFGEDGKWHYYGKEKRK